MGTIIGILIIVALIGAVIWNKRNSTEAMNGVEFTVAAAPDVVIRALQTDYCGGPKAMAKSMLFGIKVTAVGGSAFRVDTRLGDLASIEIREVDHGASIVTAQTNELYVGSHPSGHFRKGIMGISASIVHTIFKLLGISPNAARLKRFQRSIEGRLSKELQRSTHGGL
jgi:hypothetical protein